MLLYLLSAHLPLPAATGEKEERLPSHAPACQKLPQHPHAPASPLQVPGTCNANMGAAHQRLHLFVEVDGHPGRPYLATRVADLPCLSPMVMPLAPLYLSPCSEHATCILHHSLRRYFSSCERIASGLHSYLPLPGSLPCARHQARCSIAQQAFLNWTIYMPAAHLPAFILSLHGCIFMVKNIQVSPSQHQNNIVILHLFSQAGERGERRRGRGRGGQAAFLSYIHFTCLTIFCLLLSFHTSYLLHVHVLPNIQHVVPEEMPWEVGSVFADCRQPASCRPRFQFRQASRPKKKSGNAVFNCSQTTWR